MDNEFEKMNEALKTLGNKIESDIATKAEVQNFAALVKALDQKIDRKNLDEKTEEPSIFKNKAQAIEFIDVLKGALVRDGKHLTKDSGFYSEKTAGDPLTTAATNAGVDIVPTSLSSTFSMLLAQGGIARQYATVYNGVQGTLDLGKRNGTSTAVFTATDDATVTATQLGTAKVSLSPKQISAISYVADKLLYVSPVNIANSIAIDLVEQAASLEDISVIRGDGTATYGSITGIKTAASVGSVTLTAANFTAAGSTLVDALLDMPSQVHESVQMSGKGRYYVSASTWYNVRKAKASTAGSYHFDVQLGQWTLGGYPVTVWHRMDTADTATNCKAIFGDLSLSHVLATGRDMSIDVDRSFRFGTNQTAFRLTYDFGAVTIQPTALSRIVLT